MDRKQFLREIIGSWQYFSRNELGQFLFVGDKKIVCANKAYVVTAVETGDVIQRMEIVQNEDSIYIEGRIVLDKIFQRIGRNLEL